MERRCVCPYDCPDSCGMIATIEQGRLLSVKGDPEHSRTAGFLCRKTQHYEEMVNHPERILYPMKRVGEKGDGKFLRISWEEALDTIAHSWKQIMEDYGPEAILPYSYAGTEGQVQKNCGEAFFHYLGASKLLRTICASGKGAGWSAIMGSTNAADINLLAESDRILVWSANLAATRLHEIPYIQKARERGARVTLIDVYGSPAARYCDEVILIRPGTDGALALTMAHILEREGLADWEFIRTHVQGYEAFFENLGQYTPEWCERETDIPADVIRELAISYGKAKKPMIVMGSGVSRSKVGAMAIRCIATLPVVTGILGRGFGMTGLSQSRKWVDTAQVSRPDFDRNHARTINMMQLATALDPERTNPPVMSLYVYHSNPLNVTANQKKVREGLERENLFTVVHERFMTDTARYADILLPAVFSPESWDIFVPYGYNGIQYSPRILTPPGECRSNWDTFCALAKAMGIRDPYFEKTEKEMCEMLLDHRTGQQAMLDEKEWQRLLDGYAIAKPLPGKLHIQTKSGKIMFENPDAEPALITYQPIGPQKYPLHLVAAPSLYSLNSSFTSQDGLMEKRGQMTLLLSTVDAAARGIRNGDRITVQNQLAQVEFYAGVTEQILPGTVVAEGVYTMAQAPNGNTVNALFSEELSDLGEATTMNGNFVEVSLRRNADAD